MSKTFGNRHEFLFLYEAVDCNPNGDPLDENRPRTDPRTGASTVTDVRIKRTIRDEILSWEPDENKRLAKGREVLIRDTHREDGMLATGKDRARAFGKVGKKPTPEEINAVQAKVLKGCIDARLFGTTLPLGESDQSGGASLKLTGAVQWSAFNRSLHRVSPQLVQMTAAFAGKKDAMQKSFAERYLLPYALIAAYGVANEIAARSTLATEEDLEAMLQALWQGTSNLATTSKLGHASLLLLDVEQQPGKHLGRLDQRVRIDAGQVEHESIRSTADYRVDVTELLEALASSAPQIRRVRFRQEPRLRTVAKTKGALALKPFVDLVRATGVAAEALA